MQRKLLVCLLLLAATCMARAEERWVPGGDVYLNGKKLAAAHYIKQGKHDAFPLLPIAAALGKKATFEAASNTITWEGTAVKDAVVVDGVPYVSWRVLAKLAPGLDYGMSSEGVYFALNARKSMPTASSGGENPNVGKVVVVNAAHPGERADIEPNLLAGKTNIVEFFSEY